MPEDTPKPGEPGWKPYIGDPCQRLFYYLQDPETETGEALLKKTDAASEWYWKVNTTYLSLQLAAVGASFVLPRIIAILEGSNRPAAAKELKKVLEELREKSVTLKEK